DVVVDVDVVVEVVVVDVVVDVDVVVEVVDVDVVVDVEVVLGAVVVVVVPGFGTHPSPSATRAVAAPPTRMSAARG
ncbi:MAG TPA: hypothetical protein PKA24_11990, partial [Microthrixaceae bacterium]|nr:hypothetical protein [Microthrixaceae bacterium]